MNDETIEIMLVDDHSLVREGIKSSLKNYESVRVVAEAANGKDALKELRDHPVDVVLMDISMDGMDGVETTKKIRKDFPDIKIMALTMHEDDAHILHMLKAGTMGYVVKTITTKNLVTAIKHIARGETYFSKRVSQAIMNRFMSAKTRKRTFGFDQLTKREIEILKLIADGLTNPEIADQLFISHRTVDSHRRNLIQKLNVKNTAGLVRAAIKNGVVEA